MKIIELMLTGIMEMSDFISLLKSETEIQNQLNSLIPKDAIVDKDHNFWKHLSYCALSQCQFNFTMYLDKTCRFDGSISDNFNVFGFIHSAYIFFFPEKKCTSKYHDALDLYLDTVVDCFDGPEVRFLIEKIIQEALMVKTKKQRKAQVQMNIKMQFHQSNSLRPRWIQGPEWPMGSHSPMKFISQKKSGELVEYCFEDVDTKSTRIVKQFF